MFGRMSRKACQSPHKASWTKRKREEEKEEEIAKILEKGYKNNK